MRVRRPTSQLRALGLIAALLCGGLLLGARPARAGDPELRYRTIETKHFRISYHEPLGVAAQRIAVIAEQVHTLLGGILKHEMRFRTEVVLTDDTDFSNGSATALPFPTVRLYLTAPEDRSELNDFDDWLLALFMHEYTHALHLDTINGLPKWLNYLGGFGVNTLYAPNQIQPRWFIEGLAVFEETERTSAGRLRSSLFDMYLRSHVLEGKFLRLDQVSNQTRLFPRGNVPYLYGSAFLRYIARRYGEKTLQEISHRYGGGWSPDTWVPWGMSRALRRITGATYGQLYEDFKKDLLARYLAQQSDIQSGPLGITPVEPLTDWKASADRPVYSPDGREILWLESDPYRRPALMRYDVATKKASVELLIDGAGGLALTPDGQGAVMARLRYFRQFFTYQDLVLYRRDRKTLVALSEGLRVDNPAVSPDGRLLAFEVNAQGTRRLGLMELPSVRHPGSEAAIDARAYAVPEVFRARAAAPVRFPLPQKDFTQVYTPTFSPDGRHLAFSYWQEGGYRDIVTLDLVTGELRYVTRDRALDLEPHYSRDGEYLYFVSDRTGVYNLYAHHLSTDTTWLASSVVSGVFSPAVAPDGSRVAHVGFVSEGFRIETMALDPARFVLAPPALLERPEPPRLPPTPLEPEQRLPVKRYNPARSFFRTPLSLLNVALPISAPGQYGQSFGLTLSTEDLFGLHRLNAGLTFYSGRADATGFFASYSYTRLWNSLSISASRSLYPRGIRVNGQSKSYDEESWTGSVSTSLPVLRDVVRAASVGLSYNFTYWRNLSPRPVLSPADIPYAEPEVGRYATLNLSFSYSDQRRFLYSVGPERGRYVSVTASLSHPAIGSQYQVYTVQAVLTQAIGIPWPSRFLRNHTLLLSYQFGISGGELKRRGTFYIGGFPAGEDFLRAAIFGQRPGQPLLRGYEPGVAFGDQLHALSAEYRFPIAWLERGYETLPLFFYRLHAAVYTDAGAAFFGRLAADQIKVSVGGEIRLDGLLGYYLPFMLQLGYAHGFMDGADSRVYFLLNNPL